jgi:hypothetical protein
MFRTEAVMAEQKDLTVETVHIEGRATSGLNAVGLIVSWTSSGEAVEADVKLAFDKGGFGRFAPKQRPLKDAMKAALVSEFSRKNRPVRPTKKGYEVVEETPADETGLTNQHGHILSAWIESNKATGGTEQVRCDIAEYEPRLQQATAEARLRVEGAAVGEALTVVAKTALHGVAIRDGGGAYWIPQASVAQWLTLADALNSVSGGVSTREFTMMGDARTAAGLVASATAKVEEAVAGMYAAIAKGDKKAKGLLTIAEDAMALAEQVETWKAALGVGLEDLLKKAEDAQGAAAQAAQIALMAQEAEAA